MSIRVLKNIDDSLVAVVPDMDNYYTLFDDIDGVDSGISESDVHIHPDDIIMLQKQTLDATIDKAVLDAGVTTRNQSVYTSNLSLLNNYLIGKIIQTNANMPADITSLANLIVQSHEESGMIYDLIGREKIVEKSIGMGHVTNDVVETILPANPE